MQVEVTKLKYHPTTGYRVFCDVTVRQWRFDNPNKAFMFDIATGQRRTAEQLADDPYCYASVPR